MKTLARLLLACACTLFVGCTDLITPTDTEALQKTAALPSDGIPVAKKKILALRFLNKSRTGGDELTFYATSKASAAFQDQTDLIIIPQTEVEGNEDFINEGGDYNIPVILEKARSLNIAGILMGSIQNVTARQAGEEAGLFRMHEYTVNATVRIQMMDAATGREIYSQLSSAEESEEHTDFLNDRTPSSYDTEHGRGAVGRAIDKLDSELPIFARKLSWSGRIAKVDLRRFYLNAGEQTGLMRGQILKVFENSQAVYDPETHALLGMAPGRFKGLIKIVDYFGADGAVAIVYSGGGFKERDRVEYFSPSQYR